MKYYLFHSFVEKIKTFKNSSHFKMLKKLKYFHIVPFDLSSKYELKSLFDPDLKELVKCTFSE